MTFDMRHADDIRHHRSVIQWPHLCVRDYRDSELVMAPVFDGTKMLIMDVCKLPIRVALGVVAHIIASSICGSIAASRTDRPKKVN